MRTSHYIICTILITAFIAWFNLAMAFLFVFLWAMWNLAHAAPRRPAKNF